MLFGPSTTCIFCQLPERVTALVNNERCEQPCCPCWLRVRDIDESTMLFPRSHSSTVRSSCLSMFHSSTCSRFCELWMYPPLTVSWNKHTCIYSPRDIVYNSLRSCCGSCSKVRQHIMCGFGLKIPVSWSLASNTHSYNRHYLHQHEPQPASSGPFLVFLHMVYVILKSVQIFARFDVFHRCVIYQ